MSQERKVGTNRVESTLAKPYLVEAEGDVVSRKNVKERGILVVPKFPDLSELDLITVHVTPNLPVLPYVGLMIAAPGDELRDLPFPIPGNDNLQSVFHGNSLSAYYSITKIGAGVILLSHVVTYTIVD